MRGLVVKLGRDWQGYVVLSIQTSDRFVARLPTFVRASRPRSSFLCVRRVEIGRLLGLGSTRALRPLRWGPVSSSPGHRGAARLNGLLPKPG